MRFDIANDSRSCLGCGRQCSDPFSFCGRCLSASYLGEKPRLSPRARKLIFWIAVFAVGGLSFWLTTELLNR
jgi:hypothetical protein